MSEVKNYVRVDENGVMRVGNTHVMLDSVVAAFEQGHSPETIRQQYPAVGLEEVYGAITYYLAHLQEVNEYLRRQDALWDDWRAKSKGKQSPVVERLRALRNAPMPEGSSRFLADHDLNEHIIDGVLRREPAVEFTRAREAGLGDRPDPEVLEYAASQGLIIVSHDVNTMPGHALNRINAGQTVAGLLMVQQTKPIGPIIDSMVIIWSASEAEEWQGQIEFLPL